MLQIGRSNWTQQAIRETLPRDRLPPGGMLQAYARVFQTVEINSTFYRFHQRQTFAGWKQHVPRGFVFSIKGNRLFTHDRGLRHPGTELGAFLSDLRQLGRNLGPILFQLPASHRADPSALRAFLSKLKSLSPDMRFTFELRHLSWHTPEIWKILEKYQMGFCIFDIRQFTSPTVTTSDLVYIRLHGPLKKPYQGRYGSQRLSVWAEKLRDWKRQKLDCFTYFDNTRFGDTVPDALMLRDLTLTLVSKKATYDKGSQP